MCEAPTIIKASMREKLPVGRLSPELDCAFGADCPELVEPVELFEPFCNRSIFQFLPPEIYTIHAFQAMNICTIAHVMDRDRNLIAKAPHKGF
jgi:hypothetical protein